MLSESEIEAIASMVDELLRAPQPNVIGLREATTRAGFGTARAFHRWAAHMGLRSLSGAKGRYSVAALDAAIERASRHPRPRR